jgi:alanine dehydrogenase
MIRWTLCALVSTGWLNDSNDVDHDQRQKAPLMSHRIVVCGAGEVGTHIAEMAAIDNSVTVIDSRSDRIVALDETVDVSTVTGSCTDARFFRRPLEVEPIFLSRVRIRMKSTC